MPNIAMLDIEQLRKTKLRPYIDKCLEHRAPDPGFHAMMGHNIDLCEAMFVARDACFNRGRIPHTLKEVIRVSFRGQQTVVIEAMSGLLRRSDKDYRSSCSMKASIITPGASASPLPRRLRCATAS